MQERRRIIGQQLLHRRKHLDGVGVTARALQRDAEIEPRLRIVWLKRQGADKNINRLGKSIGLQAIVALRTQELNSLRIDVCSLQILVVRTQALLGLLVASLRRKRRPPPIPVSHARRQPTTCPRKSMFNTHLV